VFASGPRAIRVFAVTPSQFVDQLPQILVNSMDAGVLENLVIAL
jgi:hypothetical protein